MGHEKMIMGFRLFVTVQKDPPEVGDEGILIP